MFIARTIERCTKILAHSPYTPRNMRNWAKGHLPKSKDYFNQNKSKIQTILKNLADDYSQKTFSDLIYCRINKQYPIEYCPDTQYFPQDIFKLSQNEIFIDCGAYIGDTIRNFIKICNNRYKKIVAFEPEPTLFHKLKQNNFPSCICINGGVWKNKDNLPFLALGSAGSRLELADTSGNCNPNQLINVPVYKIDDTSACSDMTFLKMDIEGSELNALKGAEKTIRKNKPKLAVCIYHSDTDMLEIPLWILSLNMGYKLYVRHYSKDLWETVLYTI